MENKAKKKLRRRGTELYKRYFFNPNDVIEMIVEQIDNGLKIDEILCEVIFNIPIELDTQRYELIMYYPNKLKEIKYINEQVINNLYAEYGETITIMKNNSTKANARGAIAKRAQERAKLYNTECNITSEDIKLISTCPLLNVPLEYNNNVANNFSASLDRINPSLGYIKGNIQVVSMLANSMKSSASPEQLITFSKNVLQMYDK